MRLEALPANTMLSPNTKDLALRMCILTSFMNQLPRSPCPIKNKLQQLLNPSQAQCFSTNQPSQLKCYQIFHMEDLIGEIYFSKRQNVSLKNSLVMHKGLLGL